MLYNSLPHRAGICRVALSSLHGGRNGLAQMATSAWNGNAASPYALFRLACIKRVGNYKNQGFGFWRMVESTRCSTS